MIDTISTFNIKIHSLLPEVNQKSNKAIKKRLIPVIDYPSRSRGDFIGSHLRPSSRPDVSLDNEKLVSGTHTVKSYDGWPLGAHR